MYKLYVIPGSHACRSAILMLEHKRVPYRRVEVFTGLHPLALRLRGFRGSSETRAAGGRRPIGLRLGDNLGTVPAMAANGNRISTNRGIARFLDDRHPEPPLFPSDPEQRQAVEEVERWANEDLQMTARRIGLAAAVEDPVGFTRATADGRMGHLLYRTAAMRRLIVPHIGRGAFAAGASTGRRLLAELPPTLDRIDAWIGDGTLGTEEPNAADFMVAPSLALILYRPDAQPLFEGRPALALVDRLLPPPAARGGASDVSVSRPT